MKNQCQRLLCILVSAQAIRFSVAFALTLVLMLCARFAGGRAFGQAQPARDDRTAMPANINYDAVRAMALQPDGKMIVAGFTRLKSANPGTASGKGSDGSRNPKNSKGDFALARYLPDGSPDASFGEGGKVVTDFAGNDDRVNAIALQADGKIVLVGFTSWNDCDSDFALARYNSDGTLDASFGRGGKVVTDFFGGKDEAFAVAIQSDGRIVAMGRAYDNRLNLALARYTQRGRLDPTFGKGGKVTMPSNRFAYTRAISLRRDGSILVAGGSSACTADCGSATSFALTRYHSDGRLDTSFGDKGTVATSWRDPVVVASAIAVQPDGKSIMVGNTNGEGRRASFALQRFNEDGSLDDSFGSKGKVTALFNHPTQAKAIGFLPDGSFVVAGSTGVYSPGGKAFALARYSKNGELDLSFGEDGKVITPCGGYGEVSAIALQPDGGIIVGGYVETRDIADFLLIRYDKDGALDSAFGNAGRVYVDFNGIKDKALALAPKQTRKPTTAHKQDCAGGLRIEMVQVNPRLEPRRDEIKITGLPNPRPPVLGAADPKLEPRRDDIKATGVPSLPSGEPSTRAPGSNQTTAPASEPVSSVDSKPVLLSSTPPRYTEEARANKIQGMVTARLFVGADGQVKQVKITRGLPDGLDQQAIQAAYQYRYKPAFKDDKPVAYWVVVQIEFKLP